MLNIFPIHLLALAFLLRSAAYGQERLFFPDDVDTHNAVVSAANWLTKHVRQGKLNREGRECSGSVIGWKDTTLNPELTPGPDVTGEATAIFMLAKTVVSQ